MPKWWPLIMLFIYQNSLFFSFLFFFNYRLLSSGAAANAQTPSGRSALHAACAMGNLGCIDSLLQHNAVLDIKDAHGRTPAQVAFQCGQQDAERRILLFQRVRKQQNQDQKRLNQSWPRSSRFPVSKLAQSTSPTLALQVCTMWKNSIVWNRCRVHSTHLENFRIVKYCAHI